jgi:hypothetical protein
VKRLFGNCFWKRRLESWGSRFRQARSAARARTTVAEERSTVEILKAARERITDPQRWAKGDFAYAPDEETGERGVEAGHPDACKWCASGAIQREDNDEHSLALHALCAAIPGTDEWSDPTDAIEAIARWNDDDSRDHAEVLAAFDRAIQLAEQEVTNA